MAEDSSRVTIRIHFALRPQKRDGLLGTGTGGEGDERVKARPRARMGSIESDAGITVNNN